MTPDELKSLPKGTFVVMKTGFYPMKVKLKLFFKWGIEFEEKYEVKENGNREVHYANRSELFNNIIKAYSPVTDSDFDEASDDKKKKMKILRPLQMRNRPTVTILLIQNSKTNQQKNLKIQTLNRTQTSKEK